MGNDVRRGSRNYHDHRRPERGVAFLALALASAVACAGGAEPAEPQGATTGAGPSTAGPSSTAMGSTSTATSTGTATGAVGTTATGGITTGSNATSGTTATTTATATTSGGASNTATGASTSAGGFGVTGSASITATGSGGASSDTGATTTGGSGGDASCAIAVHDPSDPPGTLTLSGNLGAHDPVLIEADGVWYEFQTGPRIYGKTSTDLVNWDGTPSALGDSNPAWVAQRVPGATDLWAPDISFFNGQYHLYYSASTFGSNTSCIGHATRPSLASGSWNDQGPVICSQSSDDFNAIDPNLILDEQGTPFLSFGSFWDGIRAIRLSAEGARADDELHALASRGGGAIEAPFIVRRCGYYYLFVSFDRCCQGADSTYNIRVGRSENVLGPYVDQAGVPMLDGGGTLLVSGNDSWKGPGHNAVIFDGDKAYNVYHAYAASNGAATLRISELVWNAEGWPISGAP